MKKISGLFFLWLLAAMLPDAHSQTEPDCTDNNGGCSDYCLSPGAPAESFCSCPCGQTLSADNRNCSVAQDCGVDLYIAIDRRGVIDGDACSNAVPGPFPNWISWRDDVGSFVSQFSAFEADSNNRVGVQLFSLSPELKTIVNYTSNNVGDIVSDLSAIDTLVCNESSTPDDILGPLIGATDAPPGGYLGPSDGLRPKASTTRIAIFFIYENSMMEAEVTLGISRMSILESFNQIIVVTRTQTNATLDQLNTERARLIACGDIASCRNVFWLDRNNDFGLPLSYLGVLNTMELDACSTDAGGETAPLTNLDCSGRRMAFSLALCPLAGLTLEMLEFKDPGCNLTAIAVAGADNTVTLDIAFGACGMTEEYVVSVGVVKKQFTQTITNRNLLPSQVLPEINYTITCNIATLTDFYSFGLSPKSDKRNGTATDTGIFELSYNIFDDSSFGPLAPDMNFVIGCDVFVEVEANILDLLKLVLWTCWATPSADPSDAVNYTLADNGCPVDNTFLPLDNPTSNVFRFSFEMFEFSSGYKKATNDKPPVYIHCKFWICLPDDNSISCNPSCPGRKKRVVSDSSEEEKKSVSSTFGPFFVEDSAIDHEEGNLAPKEAKGEVEAPLKTKKPTITENSIKKESQQLRPIKQEKAEDLNAVDKQRKVSSSSEDGRRYSTDNSIRRIQIVMPASTTDWANSLWSMPSMTFLLLLSCLLIVIMFTYGIMKNPRRTQGHFPDPIFPDMQLPFKQDLSISDELEEKDIAPPPEYKP